MQTTKVENLDSKRNVAQFEPIRFAPPVNEIPANNDFKDYTARIEKVMASMTEALNSLVRILQPQTYAVTASGAIVATAASQIVVWQNPDRKFCSITNADVAKANNITLNLGAVATVNTGIVLFPGGTFTFGANTDEKYLGEVSVVSEGANVLTVWVEA